YALQALARRDLKKAISVPGDSPPPGMSLSKIQHLAAPAECDLSGINLPSPTARFTLHPFTSAEVKKAMQRSGRSSGGLDKCHSGAGKTISAAL
ncbi:hypothetical protein ADUPG1_005615, partial [Aduncisulcus paluster]